jgi:hypothetical protein
LSTLHSLKRLFPLALLACVLQTPLANAALLSLQPDTTFAANGDSMSLDLVVSGLGDFSPNSLGSFDVSVGFDPAVLAFTGYDLNSFLGDLGVPESFDVSGGASGGTVNVAQVSLLSTPDLDALQPGEFILASLNFDVLDLEGTETLLSIMPNAVLGDANGSAIDVTGVQPALVVGRSPLPVPGTMLLLLTSLCSWRVARQLHQRSA